MVVSKKSPVPTVSIFIEGNPIQQVTSMICLVYMATKDGKCENEIKSIIAIASPAFEKLSKILTSRNLNIKLKLRITKCYIWSTFLYRAETWTFTKTTSNKFGAFEIWLYRRMLWLSWTEHKTNEEILMLMNTKRSLVNTIQKRKCVYFGHIIYRDNIQRIILEGRINERQGRGWLKIMWIDNTS